MGTTKRNYRAESLQAKKNAALSVVEIRASRDAGTLGAEVIKMAQVLIRATIPYSKTQEEEVTTITTLADGSKLTVTLVATDRKKVSCCPSEQIGNCWRGCSTERSAATVHTSVWNRPVSIARRWA